MVSDAFKTEGNQHKFIFLFMQSFPANKMGIRLHISCHDRLRTKADDCFEPEMCLPPPVALRYRKRRLKIRIQFRPKIPLMAD
jgi:hypothetical protein